MTGPRTSPPPLSLVRLFGDSFRLLFGHFGILFPLALVPALLQEVVFLALVPGGEAQMLGNPFTTPILLSLFLSFLLSYFLMGLVTLAAADCLNERRSSLGSYIRQVGQHILPIVLVGTLISVAAGLGAAALIVPGLYILARYFVWLPCILFEDAGMGAPGRTQALTEGYRWPLVGGILMLGLLMMGSVFIAGPLITAGFSGVAAVIPSAISGAFQAFTNAITSIFMTLVYFRLRDIRPAD